MKTKSERRCSDCKEFHAGQFSICDRCAAEKYIPAGKWCTKHGPTFGPCFACKSASKRVGLQLVPANVSPRAAVAVARSIAKSTHRITSQPQHEFVAYLTEGAQ